MPVTQAVTETVTEDTCLLVSHQSCRTSPVTNSTITCQTKPPILLSHACQTSPTTLLSYACQTSHSLLSTAHTACQTCHTVTHEGSSSQDVGVTNPLCERDAEASYCHITEKADWSGSDASGGGDVDSEYFSPLRDDAGCSTAYISSDSEGLDSFEYESAFIDISSCEDLEQRDASSSRLSLSSAEEMSMAVVRRSISADMCSLHVPRRVLSLELCDEGAMLMSRFLTGLTGSYLRPSAAQFDLSLLQLRRRMVGGLSLSLQSFNSAGSALSSLVRRYHYSVSQPVLPSTSEVIESANPIHCSEYSQCRVISRDETVSDGRSAAEVSDETDSVLTLTANKAKSSSSLPLSVSGSQPQISDSRHSRSLGRTTSPTLTGNFEPGLCNRKHFTLSYHANNTICSSSKSARKKDKITWRSPHIKLKKLFEKINPPSVQPQCEFPAVRNEPYGPAAVTDSRRFGAQSPTDPHCQTADGKSLSSSLFYY